jgi:hypothetical protein
MTGGEPVPKRALQMTPFRCRTELPTPRSPPYAPVRLSCALTKTKQSNSNRRQHFSLCDMPLETCNRACNARREPNKGLKVGQTRRSPRLFVTRAGRRASPYGEGWLTGLDRMQDPSVYHSTGQTNSLVSRNRYELTYPLTAVHGSAFLQYQFIRAASLRYSLPTAPYYGFRTVAFVRQTCCHRRIRSRWTRRQTQSMSYGQLPCKPRVLASQRA